MRSKQASHLAFQPSNNTRLIVLLPFHLRTNGCQHLLGYQSSTSHLVSRNEARCTVQLRLCLPSRKHSSKHATQRREISLVSIHKFVVPFSIEELIRHLCSNWVL